MCQTWQDKVLIGCWHMTSYPERNGVGGVVASNYINVQREIRLV